VLRAVLYDIHGNLPALESVIADAAASGVERFVLGGDYALFGAHPAETVARLNELDATWIRGNTDRWLVDAHDTPQNPLVDRSLVHCREALGEPVCRALADKPTTAELHGALICHASPRSDMVSFSPELSESDSELIEPGDPEVIVFGHTHLQFKREANGRTLVNPGSVGLPFDGDRRAAYALWREGKGFELRRVTYDNAAYALDLRRKLSATLGDAVDTLVRRLEQAAFVN
jgi:putative phosphoesterase